jgi:hypothetical protein
MAWLSSFLLGRPGYENSFDVNPNKVMIDESQIVATNRVLSGHARKWVFRTNFPTISLDSSFFTEAQKDIMASLLTVTDTFLSFQVRDDLKIWGEANIPTSTSTVLLQENSATLLSTALVAAGFSSIITVTGVYTTPPVNGVNSGSNYYSGGSYSDATRTVTLGSVLPGTSQVYCNYTYKGWLVNMEKINHTATGGNVDTLSFSGWTLEGV